MRRAQSAITTAAGATGIPASAGDAASAVTCSCPSPARGRDASRKRDLTCRDIGDIDQILSPALRVLDGRPSAGGQIASSARYASASAGSSSTALEGSESGSEAMRVGSFSVPAMSSSAACLSVLGSIPDFMPK
jgi:hypothetical protein